MTLKGFVCPCCQGIPALPQSHSAENSSRAPHSSEGDLMPAGSLGRSWDHSSHLRGLLTNPPSPCPQGPFSPGSTSRIFLKFKSKQTSQQGLDPGRPGRCPGLRGTPSGRTGARVPDRHPPAQTLPWLPMALGRKCKLLPRPTGLRDPAPARLSPYLASALQTHGFFLSLGQDKFVPTPGPLHLLFLKPERVFPQLL